MAKKKHSEEKPAPVTFLSVKVVGFDTKATDSTGRRLAVSKNPFDETRSLDGDDDNVNERTKLSQPSYGKSCCSIM